MQTPALGVRRSSHSGCPSPEFLCRGHETPCLLEVLWEGQKGWKSLDLTLLSRSVCADMHQGTAGCCLTFQSKRANTLAPLSQHHSLEQDLGKDSDWLHRARWGVPGVWPRWDSGSYFLLFRCAQLFVSQKEHPALPTPLATLVLDLGLTVLREVSLKAV